MNIHVFWLYGLNNLRCAQAFVRCLARGNDSFNGIHGTCHAFPDGVAFDGASLHFPLLFPLAHGWGFKGADSKGWAATETSQRRKGRCLLSRYKPRSTAWICTCRVEVWENVGPDAPVTPTAGVINWLPLQSANTYSHGYLLTMTN